MTGKVWRDNRRFCMSTLRNLGFGKSVMEDKLAVFTCSGVVVSFLLQIIALILHRDYCSTENDIVVEDLFIPKGTVVLFNLWAVSRDPSLWKNPHRYDPTRFLREDGSLIREKPSYHVGFSFGKRSCPGEAFAIMQIFLLVTFTLQRYNVELGDQLPCELDDPAIDLGVLRKMRLRFERRSVNTETCNDVRE
ncbi:cytochrome P450 2D9-like [Rhipicephalus sanguineus]|uniref:cytochrome P450 2D9-like n=1 Tax=Rhipicephalus sanguineus TaxID=34632 RepID=UPI0020C50526|nr:cytochrome P450 2D9-like [Rhipicephalus sanguineus]